MEYPQIQRKFSRILMIPKYFIERIFIFQFKYEFINFKYNYVYNVKHVYKLSTKMNLDLTRFLKDIEDCLHNTSLQRN